MEESDALKDEKTKAITKIMRDASLTLLERQHQIQQILAGNIIQSNEKTEINEQALNYSCSHYEKKCSNFYFQCCSRRDHCHRCHKELRSCTAPKITEIICDECNTPQEPGNSCINCNIQFSTNYCPLCTIFTSKQIYHCNDCGLCRVGERDDMFHCHTCVACYHKSGQLSHVCAITPLTELTCPLCLDSIHSSQFSSTTLLCGHMVHFPCIKKSLEKQEYRCGLCRRSMIDMKPSWAMIRNEISMQPMPEQDRKQVNYSCFDCGHKGSTTYHYLGMECTKCNGYNTSR